jgi:hypothetical protein
MAEVISRLVKIYKVGKQEKVFDEAELISGLDLQTPVASSKAII